MCWSCDAFINDEMRLKAGVMDGSRLTGYGWRRCVCDFCHVLVGLSSLVWAEWPQGRDPNESFHPSKWLPLLRETRSICWIAGGLFAALWSADFDWEQNISNQILCIDAQHFVQQWHYCGLLLVKKSKEWWLLEVTFCSVGVIAIRRVASGSRKY